jgi:hypothetical protein
MCLLVEFTRGAGHDLIMGIRPEHLKDAELVGADERVHGLTQGHRDRR